MIPALRPIGVVPSRDAWPDTTTRPVGPLVICAFADVTGLDPGRVVEILDGQSKNVGTATLDRLHETLRQVEAERSRKGP